MQRAYARAISILRQSLSVEEIARAIREGRLDDILTERALNDALLPLRQQIPKTMERGFALSSADIKGAFVSGPRVNIHFDVLNPRVQRAIQNIATPAISTITEQAQQVVRDTVEAGLLHGQHPTAIARDLREAIGMAPQHARWLRNLETELRSGDLSFARRKLLQSRTAGSLRKLIEAGKPIPEARIQSVLTAYRKSLTAMNTEANTRLLALDSYRAARRESYASAIERGIIDAARARKTWVHFEPQNHPRPVHAAAQGLTVPFDAEYVLSDGTKYMNAGEGDYNCRCSDRYHVAPLPRPIVV